MNYAECMKYADEKLLTNKEFMDWCEGKSQREIADMIQRDAQLTTLAATTIAVHILIYKGDYTRIEGE